MKTYPFPKGPIVDGNGVPTLPGKGYLAGIEDLSRNTVAVDGTIPMSAPFTPKSYTIATVPDAAIYPNAIINISDGGKAVNAAQSNGTDWIYMLDGTTVP